MKTIRIFITAAWCIVIGAVLVLFISLYPARKTGHTATLKKPATNVEVQKGNAPASLP